ncbi:MAG: S8 family serine peptidase [Anaerolineae bacterium]|nr:S8 family serine peptidase [Thermoflexales bacterium]MDW8406154.1 S8 family serine peptidase [Anaerolineae bacterium]
MKYVLRVVLLVAVCGMGFPAPSGALTSPGLKQFVPSAVSLPRAHPVLTDRLVSLSPALQRALESALPGAHLRVIVRLHDSRPSVRASVLGGSEAPDALPREVQIERRRTLARTLQQLAAESQASLHGFLARPEIAAQVAEKRSFWIFNGIALRATPEVIKAIAKREDVASIALDEWRQWIALPAPGLPISPPLLLPLSSTLPLARSPVSATLGGLVMSSPPGLGETTWGIAQIGADRVWRGLNITGTGVVVANIDTGVDWNHPALRSRYRGWAGGPMADHLHNWFDATNEAAAYPTDMHGHGTHTVGTIVGQNGIGVAPGARWMAAKGLNGAGYGLYSWLHAAFEFMLAPGGDPAYAPDVLSNSWGSDNGLDTEFAADIAALRAAGIVVVFANGNRGPGWGTVGSPASLPGAFGVGASDPDDEVAYFSSRGPSPLGPTRPDMVAPGVEVVSTFPGGVYATASGTSMATPHVAGVAALVLSANPALTALSVTRVLTATAVPLSTTLPNNLSGWGRLDAYRAVLSVIQTGVITGHVLDIVQPISGALVTARAGAQELTTLTDADGRYSIPAPFGIYTVSVAAFGYQPATSTPRLVLTHSATVIHFTLSALPSGIVRGVVTDVVSGAYLTTTVVRALGTPESSLANGGSPARYYALNLPAGVYTVEARLLGYGVQTRTVVVSDGSISELNFGLTRTQRIGLVDSGAWYYASAADYYRRALDDLGLPYDVLRVKQVPADTPTITRLLAYDTIIWSAPFDSPAYIGAGDVVSRYLSAGRNLMLSGQDVAFYDGGGFGFHPYFSKLKAAYLADDAPSRVVTGSAGSLLAGAVLTIAGGDGADNQYLVDVVRPLNLDQGRPLGQYTADPNDPNAAGVYAAQCLNYKAAYFAFGFEAINSAAARADTMKRVLDGFAALRPTLGVETVSRDAYLTGPAIGLPGQVVTHLVRLRNTGEAGVTQTFALSLTSQSWPAALLSPTVTLAPCGSALVVISVTIPLSTAWNASNEVTVTAWPLVSPAIQSALSFTSKTPAGILLVDDDRFYNREQDYLNALMAQSNIADRWDTRWGSGLTNSPPITTLRMYPLVVWFNGYDWFDPIRPQEERALQDYLDGGGRLLFSSQAALFYTQLSDFTRNDLGVAAIDYEDTFSNVVGAPTTAIGEGFDGGSLLDSFGRFPYFWNLSTSLQPLSGTQVILRGDSGQPAALAREKTRPGHAPPARAVFLPFAFEALTETVRADLMNRIVAWLSWLGRSSLTPHAPLITAGETVTFTLVLRADEVISSPLTITPTVSISTPVGDDLWIISSTLPNWTPHYAGEWNGSLQAGMALTWTFVATTGVTLPAGSHVTATLHVAVQQPGIRFTRQAGVRVGSPGGAPHLVSSLEMQPAAPAWLSLITFTARLTNSGALAAPAATLTAVIPTGLILLTPTVQTPLVGGTALARNRIVWTGPLAAGASVSVTYGVSVPAFSPPQRDFYHAVLTDDGAAMRSQSAVWVSPAMRLFFLPLVVR